MKDKKKLAIISVAIIVIIITMGAIKMKNTRDRNLMAEKIAIEKAEAEAEKLEAEKEEAERLAAEKFEAEKVEAERKAAEKAEADRLAAINPLENIKLSYGVYDVNDDQLIAKPAPYKNVIHFYKVEESHNMSMDTNRFSNNSSMVSSMRPGSELTLSFENNGDTIPKDPSIILDFDMIMLDPDLSEYLQYYDDGMEASNHVHGMGYYSKFKWYLGPRNILYKDQPVTMSSLQFAGSEIENGTPGELKITLVDSEANKVEYDFIIEIESHQ